MKVKNNIITKGLSGKLADQLIFNQRNGKTVVSRIPRTSNIVPPGRKATNDRFQEASAYAKKATFDPNLKKIYAALAKPGTSAYAVALGDYLDTPRIEQLITGEYTGTPGTTISIFTGIGDIIQHVQVIITSAEGEILETGYAIKKANQSIWIYTTQVHNATLVGTIISVEAADYAGNKTTRNSIIDG